MSSGFHYSETSAFTPVPYDVYDCTMQPNMGPHGMDTEVIMPICEFENRYPAQPYVDQWVASSHQPNYEPGLSFSLLAYPYIHECLGEPGFIRKRNERERMRVRNVNEGYAILREHLPIEPTEKRLSKVETLRGAIRYIKMLERILKESDSTSDEEKKKELTETDSNNNQILGEEGTENNFRNDTQNDQDNDENASVNDVLTIQKDNNNNNISKNKNEDDHLPINTPNIVDMNNNNNNNINDENNNCDHVNSITLDENNNIIFEDTNIELDLKRKIEHDNEDCMKILEEHSSDSDDHLRMNIGKSFERLSKELIYSEQFLSRELESDEQFVYIDVEKA